MDSLVIPKELLSGPIWNNDKPYSEAQAYIQFISWAQDMGGATHFIHNSMITLKENEFIMSQRKIADVLNWTQSSVSRFLKKLVALNQCCIKSESKMTRITLSIVADTQKSDSMMTQSCINDDSLFDNTFGGGNNSNNISNNYNNYNNNTNSNNNTTTNTNLFKKPTSKVVVKGKAKPFTTKPKDLQMVKDYFAEKHPNYLHQAEDFYEYYESVGWKRGKTPIKVWRMAVGNWVRSDFNRQSDSGREKGSWVDKFKKSTTGDYIVFCSNPNCKHYGDSLFCPTPQHIKQGCKCSHRFTHIRPVKQKPMVKPKEESFEKEELITFEQFSKSEGEKKPPKGSRATEGNSQHISSLLSSLFQQGPRRGQS